jgi:hypothetical protein
MNLARVVKALSSRDPNSMSHYAVKSDRGWHRPLRTMVEDSPPRGLMKRASMLNPICPDCSKGFVKRVSPKGICERLITLFYVYPFRCQLCGYRFKHPQWGVRYLRINEDQREYDRIAASFPVMISANDTDTQGIVTDISMGGCTLTSAAKLARGDILGLALQLASQDLPLIVEAAIVRNVRSTTAGIEFLSFQEYDRARLQIFIRGLLLSGNRSLSLAHDRTPRIHARLAVD